MKKLLLTLALGATVASGFATTIEAGKVYKISNRNDNNLYVKDNGNDVIAMGAFDDNSYWEFEATGTANHFYVKNKVTGRYAQECSTSAEVNVTLGNSPVEYVVIDCSGKEGTDCFGLTTTNESVTDFTAGCIGWNWKGDNTVQTFAAVAGTNHRSFWKITEVAYEAPADNWPLDGKVVTITNRIRNHSVDSYMQDNSWADNRVECASAVNAYSYWTFAKTANKNCYYVKNVATGRYLQGYEANTEVAITLGDTPAEYFVKSFESEGGAYGFTYTGNTPHNCDAGTIGLNLRGESDEADCLVQTYAAVAGTNHRSFWIVNETEGAVMNIGAAGWATFVAPFDVEVPASVEAYRISAINTGYVSLEAVTEVPVGEAVVVKAAEGTYTAEATTGATIGTNELEATTSALTVNEASKYYVLANGAEGVGFYPVATETTIAAGKGYFVTETAGAKFISLDGEATAIKVVETINANDAIYNLAGQQMAQPVKGINIVGGRKYVTK